MPSVKLWILYRLPEEKCKGTLIVGITKYCSDHRVRPVTFGTLVCRWWVTEAKFPFLGVWAHPTGGICRYPHDPGTTILVDAMVDRIAFRDFAHDQHLPFAASRTAMAVAIGSGQGRSVRPMGSIGLLF
ncbi:hypothetical protein [Desulfosarcina cetonica]|uniref:hypothetical protein n=1 Tax=Desulfosarcina cetonica TaxID=90730 RepID=UPI0012EED6A6|nr:hypothetical protein [Desulfosarcina cetonica]